MYAFRSVFFDFLWVQPTDFDIVPSVASSITKQTIFEADMVPQIRGTTFERIQGRVVHGDFGRFFRIFVFYLFFYRSLVRYG